jgi:spore coat protein JB
MNERNTLLKQITVLDFMAVDLHLYLNTHPGDNSAITMYNEAVTRAAELREKFEARFGPMTAFRSTVTAEKPWADDCWPWQADSNFNVVQEQEAML